MTRMRTLKQVRDGKKEDAERINSEKIILDIEKANEEGAFAGVLCTSENMRMCFRPCICAVGFVGAERPLPRVQRVRAGKSEEKREEVGGIDTMWETDNCNQKAECRRGRRKTCMRDLTDNVEGNETDQDSFIQIRRNEPTACGLFAPVDAA
ncbi:hypothetical protein B0H14DRAFT_3150161 [Mycena olivaceomarginata]|nr:hypothetical protein B0H14DRAFT_3150161 [Mycena olivaceomarginata]